MNVMQSLMDFKQNLQQAHPRSRAGAAQPPAATGRSRAVRLPEDSTTITANDFLQLLVAEMKNQDPTADQDPNAYIDQLVQVNSLQQLIAINQDLTSGGRVRERQAARRVGRQHRPRNREGCPPPSQQLGSAAGTPAATVATALVPHPASPGGAGRDRFRPVRPASGPTSGSGPECRPSRRGHWPCCDLDRRIGSLFAPFST